MSGLSDFGENLVQNFRLNNAAVTRPTTWFVGLHTGDPGETGAANEVSTGGGSGYARQAVTFGASAAGIVANTGLVLFGPAVTAWGTITHVSIWDTVAAGNCLDKGPLSTAMRAFTSIVAGNLITSPAHGLVVNDRAVFDDLFGAMPTGMVAGTVYFVLTAPSADTLTVSATLGGAALALSTVGLGQLRKVTPQVININDSFQFLTGLLTDQAF